MLKPLEQFICDTCGQIIEKTEDGYVEWLSSFDEEKGRVMSKEFRIVHHHAKSPLNSTKAGCYNHDLKHGRSDVDLKSFLAHKHQYIFSFLNPGFLQDPQREIPSEIEDYAEFSDFGRRVTIPYYEEARTYFSDAENDSEFNGCNEIQLFTENVLKDIIQTYSE